jgi:hypothetical protein
MSNPNRPVNPKHKSIIVVDDYDKKDGIYKHNTDAQSLSIGLAQWDNNDISGKVFRRKNDTWIRSSEELPLHRILDLSILTISSFIKSNPNSDTISNSLEGKVIDIDNLELIRRYYLDNKSDIDNQINELQRVISLLNQIK